MTKSALPSLLVGPEDASDRVRFFHDKVSPWVSKGTVYAFAMQEELARPTIVEHESAIAALAVVSTGSVLGITTGRRGHLFYFHPSYGVVDVGVLDEEVAGAAIVAARDDHVVGGWSCGKGGGLFRHSARLELGTGQEDFFARKEKIERIPLPGRAEGIVALADDAERQSVYGITTLNRIVSLKDGSRRPRITAESDATLSPVLTVLGDGTLLGACEEGQLWQCRPAARRVEPLGVFAPCEKGKRYVAGVSCLLRARDGRVYGGTGSGGFLFTYDPAKRRISNLGKPHRQSFIRGLAEGHDGLIYGVVGEPQGLAQFFTFDPDARTFENLGLLSAFITVQWTPHRIGAICTGRNGEIFLGENDTVSHLFVYYPPVCARPDAADGRG